jgi:hypothetical protein
MSQPTDEPMSIRRAVEILDEDHHARPQRDEYNRTEAQQKAVEAAREYMHEHHDEIMAALAHKETSDK